MSITKHRNRSNFIFQEIKSNSSSERRYKAMPKIKIGIKILEKEEKKKINQHNTLYFGEEMALFLRGEALTLAPLKVTSSSSSLFNHER